MRRIFNLTAIGLFVLAISCGGSQFHDGEDYGDILGSPDGLILTEEEHEIGWGHADCDMCHNLENIHLVDRSGLGIDIEAIYDQVLEDGIEGCSTCHGDNGVD